MVCDEFSVGEQNTNSKGGEKSRSCKTRMRSRPATGTASFVGSCSRCLSPRSGAMTASTMQPSEEYCLSRSQLPICNLAITNLQLLRDASGPACPRSRWGKEAATPGLPVAFMRVSGSFPSAIRFRELPAATGSAAIIRQDQERSRFAAFTVIQFGAPGNRKFRRLCAEPVDDETSLWKAEEN